MAYARVKKIRLAVFSFWCFIILLLAAFLIQCLLEFARGSFFAYRSNNTYHFIDFVSFYMAGKLTLSATRTHIYDIATQLACYNKIIAPIAITHGIYQQNTPIFFCLMAPFALLGLSSSFLVWTGLNLALGLSALLRLCRAFAAGYARHIPLFLLAVLASFPQCHNLRDGQTAWIELAALCFFYLCLLGRRDVLSGAFLALAALKPQYAIFFVVPALVQKRWKVLLSFAVVEIILNLVAGSVLDFSNVLSYPSVLCHADAQENLFGVQAFHMVSIRGLLTLLAGPALAFKLSMIATIASLIFAVFFFSQSRPKGLPAQHRAFAVLIVLMLVVSAHSQNYDCLLLAFPAVLTLPELCALPPGTSLSPAARIWKWIFIGYPVISWLCMSLSFFDPRAGDFALLGINSMLLVCGLRHTSWFRSG